MNETPKRHGPVPRSVNGEFSTRRMQVLVTAGEFARYADAARRQGTSVSRWARLALEMALITEAVVRKEKERQALVVEVSHD